MIVTNDRSHMSEVKSSYLILGLDMGIASCGFCLIDTEQKSILEMGAHLFDTPVEPKSNMSLATKRRAARSVRRNTKRRRDRQKHCLTLLINHGIVPEGASKEWLHSTKGDLPMLTLRAKALDEMLDDRQLAQVLYNLSARRGYIPHGEGRASDDTDTRKVISALDSNTVRMKELGYRTVGEMFYHDGRSRNKKGKYDLCVKHSQIIDEASQIFEAQRKLGNTAASPELEEAYLQCLSWEKRSDDYDSRVYARVGKCIYFANEKRAARADLSSELCGAYERLHHLVIVKEDGQESRLSKEKVSAYLDILFSPVPLKGNKNCSLTYKYIRKNLDLSAKDYFKGVDKEESEPFEPRAWRAMRKGGISEELLRKMLNDHMLADELGEALTYASTSESLSKRLEPLGLTEEEFNQVMALPYGGKIFKGYGSRSLKALRILIDMFEDPSVGTLAEAEKASGLKELRLGRERERLGYLPPYDVYDPTCTNPVVLRAMSRARKVINAIIRIYGVPDEIHVELAGEIKHSAKEKKAIVKRQRENRSQNERLAKTAAEILGVDPSEVGGRIIQKLALREEQGCKDAYTGEQINLERLLKDDQYTQIDHILPYSRTCDDSRNNKVLVLAKSNQDKRERTPYEWMMEDDNSPNWEEYKNRVIANPKLSRKRRYLLNTSLGESEQKDFINRNLNDTRYMARAVKGWLEDTLLFPEGERREHVLAVAGSATGMLRHNWGLNFGAGNTKDRNDDRHHAVDAAVIAACSSRAIQLVAKARSESANTRKKASKDRLVAAQPWETFAANVIAIREQVIPTRMVNHKVTGRAFEDMAYGLEDIAVNDKGYHSIHRSGKVQNAGNIAIDKSGSVRLLDGIAFLRLWLKPGAQPNRRGAWLAEPVYYAELPNIANKTYIAKSLKSGVARSSWPVISQEVLDTRPITLFRGDVLLVDGAMARFWSININNAKLKMLDISTDEEVKGFPTINSWKSSTDVSVLEEDCLGHCYRDLLAIESAQSEE